MVGTAARIVSSRERAAGAAGASGADGAGLRVGSDGLGVATGSGTERATGGVSGTSGTSTSASGSTGSTSRALSRCSRLRVSTGLGTCLASACSVFLRIERMTMGSQPVRRLTVQLVAGPDFCGAFAADLRTPKVEGGAIRDPIIGSRSTAEDATAAAGNRREARAVRRRLRGALGRLRLLAVLGGLLLVVVREPAAEQVVRRGLLALGVGSHVKKVRRHETPRDRFAEGRARRVQLGSVDAM